MGELIRLFPDDVEPVAADGGRPAPSASDDDPAPTTPVASRAAKALGLGPAADDPGASSPALWLLGEAVAGVPLTATFTLARSVVRDAVERWPELWDPTFGPPNREADVPPLESLRELLLRLRLVRRRGRELLTTKRGREAAADPDLLLTTVLPELVATDPFLRVVLAAVLETLGDAETEEGGDPAGVGIDVLLDRVADHAGASGWRGPAGDPPVARSLVGSVHEVLGVCEAFGLTRWPREREHPGGRRSGVRLTATGGRVRLQVAAHGAARLTLQPPDSGPGTDDVLVTFDAKLDNAPRVGATIVLRGSHDFVDLHRAIQEAFHWLDDHLYSFWLDGGFWGASEHELRIPGGDDFMDDADARDADAVRLGDAGLVVGSTVAYVFDYGDDWRVRLTVKAIEPGGEGQLGVVRRVGTAPPQYPEWEE